MKYTILIAAGVFLMLLGSCQSPSGRQSAFMDDDSLKQQIEKQIAEKKRLGELSLQISEGRMGEAIAKYKPIIKKYSKRYGFDWRLIVAQIVQESGFNTHAKSRVGAHGLMQIMPATASEISKELDIEYIMKNPRENITAGIYHLKKQYRYYPDADFPDRTRLALASYNGGAGRVFDAQDIARYYKLPPNQWTTVRPYLTMLKKTDWELHLQVWPEGRPKYGYFYGYNETINYVDNIWDLYQSFIHILM
ncbi:MAG: transglycosylase SLT domain-containing protein [Calditrichaceae bacterium]